jgi:hypothetical protein
MKQQCLLIHQVNTGLVWIVIKKPITQPLNRIQANRLDLAQLNQASDQDSIALSNGSLGLIGSHRRLWYRNQVVGGLEQENFTQRLQNQSVNKFI